MRCPGCRHVLSDLPQSCCGFYGRVGLCLAQGVVTRSGSSPSLGLLLPLFLQMLAAALAEIKQDWEWKETLDLSTELSLSDTALEHDDLKRETLL